MKEKYSKDFNKWNQKKQEIDVYDHGRQCHEGQIWVMSFGVNIGREIDQKRLLRFIQNEDSDVFIATKEKLRSLFA